MPKKVRPVVLADRGFLRGQRFSLGSRSIGWITWCAYRQGHLPDRSRRIPLEARRRRVVNPGQLRWAPSVRYGLYHGRPRDILLNVALCWRVPKSRANDPRRKRSEEPWYLATSLRSAKSAACWYWQRGWIEQSFRDSKSRFNLKGVRVGSPARLERLLMALGIALCWLTLCWLCPAAELYRGASALRSVPGVG